MGRGWASPWVGERLGKKNLGDGRLRREIDEESLNGKRWGAERIDKGRLGEEMMGEEGVE